MLIDLQNVDFLPVVRWLSPFLFYYECLANDVYHNRLSCTFIHKFAKRARISSCAQRVGVVLARRAIMIVNNIHDVTMYNASSQSKALSTRALLLRTQPHEHKCRSIFYVIYLI